MEARSILITATLLLTSLAVLPSAEAAPGYECAEKDILKGLNTLKLRRDCTLELGVFDGAVCVGGWGTTVERDVRGHTVRVLVCTGGPFPPVEPSMTSSAMPGCPRQNEEIRPIGGVTHRFELFHNCRSVLTLNEGLNCPNGAPYRNEYDLDATTIVVYTCIDPRSATAASASQPCSETYITSPAGEVWLRDDCTFDTHLVNTRLCTDNLAGFESSRIGTSVDDYTVSVGYCYPVSTMSSSQAVIGSCDGKAINGLVTVYHGATCRTQVDIHIMDCVWNGHWETYDARKVLVRIYTCDGPGGEATTASSAALKPCGDLHGDSWLIGFYLDSSCHLTVAAIDSYRLCRSPIADLQDYRTTPIDGDHLTVSVGYCLPSGVGIALPNHCTKFQHLDGSSWLIGWDLHADCSADAGVIDGARVCPDGYQTVHNNVAGNNLYVSYCTFSWN